MIDIPEHIPDLNRLRALFIIIGLALLAILVRLWYLQVAIGAEMAKLCVELQIKSIRRIAPRGIIEDRNGKILATSRPRFIVSITPDMALKQPGIISLLATILNQPEEILKGKLKIWVRDMGRFTPCPIDRNVDIRTLTRIQENNFDLPGVFVTREPVRFYTDNGICAALLGITRPINPDQLKRLKRQGYEGGDYIGIFGLEKSYESVLRGKVGETDFAVDARGRILHEAGKISPVPGDTLRLSLDINLQQAAASALQAAGHPGAAIALDPNTGKVLAMVSMPTFDLNDYGKDYSQLLKSPDHPLINRASGSSFPCGSTFKPVTAAAGLQSGAISTSTRFYCPGYLRLGKRIFHCDETHGSIGFYRAIGQSCNVYFFHVSELVGPAEIDSWAHRFGLGERTGIDIPSDTPGLIPSPAWKVRTGRGGWYPGDTLNMAIGQGFVRTSPLQLADFTAALANGGTLWTPQLVDTILNPVTGAAVRVIKPKARGSLGLSPENLQAIVQGMEQATAPGGTAAGLQIPGITLAGKTGTAQIYRHGQKQDNALFICFAPVQNPKIAIAVIVENGGYGTVSAVPIARQMLLQYFKLGPYAPKPVVKPAPKKIVSTPFKTSPGASTPSPQAYSRRQSVPMPAGRKLP